MIFSRARSFPPAIQTARAGRPREVRWVRRTDRTRNWQSVVSFCSSSREGGVPPPPVFLAKSAETLEMKRLEFFQSAKNRKRVRMNVKKKGIDRKHVETSRPDRDLRSTTAVELRFADLNVRTLRRGGTHPHYMHECENKRVAKWAPHKCLKRKGRFSLRSSWGETQNGNGSLGGGHREFGAMYG